MKLSLSELISELRTKSKDKLILFAGAGISIGSKLPSWSEFLDYYLQYCRRLLNDFIDSRESDIKQKGSSIYSEELIEGFKKVVDSAEASKSHPLKAISLLNLKLEELPFYENLKHDIYDAVFKMFADKEPNEIHKAIIRAKFSCILTTNYDNLLTKAARELNNDYRRNVYDYTKTQQIASCMYNSTPFILHVHGSVESFLTGKPNLILTKNDYQRIAKDNSVFRFLLKSLFLDNNVIFVGFGNTDPHILDIIDEMDYFFPRKMKSNDMPTYYLLTDKVSEVDELLTSYSSLRYVIIDHASDDLKNLFEELRK
ncbi:MAG TPA: SIR2 family protein [Bacteroidia bacterium]|nr:SIR2 family protein [Bacteroidia bacterium]HRH07614.1 SIR2 family protein [Bacteroidia bacterium]